VVEALFQQAGVLRAESLEEMFDVAALLAHQPLPKGNRVALVSNASGPGSIAVEVLKAAGLEVSHLDLGFTAKAEDYRSAASQVLQNPNYDSVIGLFVPSHPAQTEAVAEVLIEVLKEARAKGLDKTVLTCLMSGGQRWRVRVGAEQVPVYRFPESAAKALSLAVQHTRWLAEPPGEIPDHLIDQEAARKAIATAKGRWLEKPEVGALLSAFGIGAGPEGGLELLLRVQTDALFGPVLSLEVPGVPLGLERTLARRITPLTDRDAQQIALRAGAEGRALEDVLLRVSRLVEELPEVAEVEVKVWSQGGLGEVRVWVG
jgi:acyl-CoA synthetase (NDP forming)